MNNLFQKISNFFKKVGMETRKKAKASTPELEASTDLDASSLNMDNHPSRTKKRRFKKKRAGEDGFENDTSLHTSPATTRPPTPVQPLHSTSPQRDLHLELSLSVQQNFPANEDSPLQNKNLEFESELQNNGWNDSNDHETFPNHSNHTFTPSVSESNDHLHDSESSLTSLDSESEDHSTYHLVHLAQDSIGSSLIHPSSISEDLTSSLKPKTRLNHNGFSESMSYKKNQPSKPRNTKQHPQKNKSQMASKKSTKLTPDSTCFATTPTTSSATTSNVPTPVATTPTTTSSPSNIAATSSPSTPICNLLLENSNTKKMRSCFPNNSADQAVGHPSRNESNNSSNQDLYEKIENYPNDDDSYKIKKSSGKKKRPRLESDVMEYTENMNQDDFEEDTEDENHKNVTLRSQYTRLLSNHENLVRIHNSKMEHFQKCQAKVDQLNAFVRDRDGTISDLYGKLDELEKTNQSLSQQISGIELDRAQNSKQVGLFSLQLNPVKLTKIVQDFEMALGKFSRNLLVHPDNKPRLRTEISKAMESKLMPVHLRQLQMLRYLGCLIYQSIYEHVFEHHPLHQVVRDASEALTMIFVTPPTTSYLRDWYLHSANAETRNTEIWDPFAKEVLSSVQTTLELIRIQVSEDHHPILLSLINEFFHLFFTVHAMDGDFKFPAMGDAVSEHTMYCDGFIEQEVPTTNGDEPSEMVESIVLFAATPYLVRRDNDGEVVFSKASVLAFHRPSQLDGLADIALTMDRIPLPNSEQASEDEVQMV